MTKYFHLVLFSCSGIVSVSACSQENNNLFTIILTALWPFALMVIGIVILKGVVTYVLTPFKESLDAIGYELRSMNEKLDVLTKELSEKGVQNVDEGKNMDANAENNQ